MRKKEIIRLIDENNAIKAHRDLLSTIRGETYWSSFYYDEKYWFPDIPEFKEYFKVLKKELLEAKKETEEAVETIQKSECSHEVRLKHHSLFSSTNQCVLCGKNVSSDNLISFQESSYRNKHTVTFVDRYQEDDDGSYIVKTGKTKEEVYNMILKILKDHEDEEEIDLIEEFSKLNLQNVEINKEKRKQENYILIIGGTNIEHLDSESEIFVSKEKSSSSLDVFKYFLSLLNTKVAVIERKETIEQENFKDIEQNHSRVWIDQYTTFGYLKTALFQVRNVPFKLIIDLSEIYDYKIEDNKIIQTVHDLNLSERFPNSHIVKISDFKDQEELERTCNHMKKLLRK